MKFRGRKLPKTLSNAQILAGLLMLVLPLAAFYQSIWLSQNQHLFTPLLLRVTSERIECPYCYGLGVVRESVSSTNYMMCPVCFAVGGHYVRRMPGRHDVLCPACVGMGRLVDPDTKQARFCRRCGGRGLITVMTNEVWLAESEQNRPPTTDEHVREGAGL